ncbi:MAG: fatty acid desaturase [Fimbriimonas sp.]|nr:fatty acid desaturase [Fimbriimonas sp.]
MSKTQEKRTVAPRLTKPSRPVGAPVRWYRPKLPKDVLAELNRKSDLKGMVQTLGYLLTLVLTGLLFVIACLRHSWLAIPALFLHGACCAFLVNGFHELVHDSVFKTRWLNRFFLVIFSFLGWYNHIAFWASHSEHHRFTLHPPDDLEVVLPQQVTLKSLLTFGIVDVKGLFWLIPSTLKVAFGYLDGEWMTYLFTQKKPEMRRSMHEWAGIVLIGHLSIGAVCIGAGYWPIAVAVSLGRSFGLGIQFLCNATQHVGLTDEYPDFRLCCRTITLNPVLQFLYWHMNYHTEHHIFAGVPCYNLGRLHRLIRAEMPECTHGLVATWRQIGWILKQQKADPSYQFVPKLPVS